MKPTIEQLAQRLSYDLKTSRLKGRSSPVNVITAKRIIEAYKNMESLKWNLEESDIRQAVWTAVVEMKQPIGSTLEGYFWCLTAQEIDVYVLPHLISRVSKQNQKIEALKEIRDKMALNEAGQEELLITNPILNYLDKKLNLERL